MAGTRFCLYGKAIENGRCLMLTGRPADAIGVYFHLSSKRYCCRLRLQPYQDRSSERGEVVWDWNESKRSSFVGKSFVRGD
jgi:hypothetical protein